jgi:mannose-1-phosphate guanylyltransferase
MERKRGDLWALILAAGEGTRMARLTSLVHGKAVPKQFAALDGDRTFVQKTVDRLAGLVPHGRTIVVVAEGQQDYAREQLRGYRGLTVLPQPMDLGTGAGVLFPLCHVLARDPNARVAIFPADHLVRDQAAFVAAVRRGLRAAEETPSGVAVLGAEPTRADSNLGWIMPDRKPRPGRSGVRAIRRIFDTAPAELAELLVGMGGLWNTNITVGSGAALWQLFEEHLPSQTTAFRRYMAHIGFPHERRIREDVYFEALPRGPRAVSRRRRRRDGGGGGLVRQRHARALPRVAARDASAPGAALPAPARPGGPSPERVPAGRVRRGLSWPDRGSGARASKKRDAGTSRGRPASRVLAATLWPAQGCWAGVWAACASCCFSFSLAAIWICTRRFCWRPSGVELSATGRSSA